jgi:hypothetical protein
MELEISSRLSEANSYSEQATFETLLYGSQKRGGPDLEKAIETVQEIYIASLPWIRGQKWGVLPNSAERVTEGQNVAPVIAEAIESCAAVMEQPSRPYAHRIWLKIDQTIEQTDKAKGQIPDTQKELVTATMKFEAMMKTKDAPFRCLTIN